MMMATEVEGKEVIRVPTKGTQWVSLSEFASHSWVPLLPPNTSLKFGWVNSSGFNAQMRVHVISLILMVFFSNISNSLTLMLLINNGEIA